MEGTLREDARIIWRFLSKYKKEFYTVMAIVFLGSLIEALIPFLYGRVIDLVVGGEAFRTIFLWLFTWFIFQHIATWSRRFLFVNGARISTNCSNDLVLLLNQHSIDLKLSYHNKNKSGKLSSRYIKAGDAMESLLESVVFWFGADFTLLLAVMILIGLYIHYLIFLLVLAGVIIFIYVSLVYSRPISEHVSEVNRSYEDAYGIMSDSVSNIKLVKANTGEEHEVRKSFEVVKGRVTGHYESFWKISRGFFFYQDFISSLLMLVSITAMVILFERGEVAVGQVVAFIGYLGLLRNPLHKAGDRISHYRRWMATVRRGYSLLEEEAEDYGTEGKIELQNVQGAVEFRDISFSYNHTREVLHSINLKVKPGEMVALVGESGVGKSTLVDLLSRYIVPTSGAVLLDGIDIQKLTLRSLRKSIAIVPQDVSMVNDTVRNNLIYGKPDATEEEIENAIDIANARDFIRDFPDGLDEQVGERGVQLSGGQKQRIAIARAVLKDPEVLILDEATSALDSKSEALVQQAMRRLMRGRTTFIIAHRLSTIVHADRIVVLADKHIMEEGTHEELLAQKGMYYKLYTLQTLAQDKTE